MNLNWQLGTTDFSLVPQRLQPPFGTAYSWLGILVWFYTEDEL